MGRKKKVVASSQDWVKELAGTPKEQWERAKQEIAKAEKRLEEAEEQGDEIVSRAEDEGFKLVDKAETEAAALTEKAEEEAGALEEKAQEELEKVRKLYADIRKAAEATDKKFQKKRAAKVNRINSLRQDIWTEDNLSVAVNMLETVKRLEEELKNEQL